MYNILKIDDTSLVKINTQESWEDEYGSMHTQYGTKEVVPNKRDWGYYIQAPSIQRLTPSLKVVSDYKDAFDFVKIVKAETVGYLKLGELPSVDFKIDKSILHISELEQFDSFKFIQAKSFQDLLTIRRVVKFSVNTKDTYVYMGSDRYQYYIATLDMDTHELRDKNVFVRKTGTVKFVCV